MRIKLNSLGIGDVSLIFNLCGIVWVFSLVILRIYGLGAEIFMICELVAKPTIFH